MARRGGARRDGSGVREALASIAPGLEEPLALELRELGIDARPTVGGVTFRASPTELYAAHLWSRLAARITVRLGSSRVRSLEGVAQLVRSLPWRDYAWPGQPVEVRATTRSSRLRHRETVERKVSNAIRDVLRGPRLPGPRPPREAVRVVIRIVDDVATVSVDASGELLHRRGWRKRTAKAPLRENLAAAVLRLARWSPGETLVDPMCGAGTFAIEAACVDLGLPAGGQRRFAFQQWPSFREEVWSALIAQVDRDGPGGEAEILAADRDPGAIAATRSNADRAGVARRLRIFHTELSRLDPPAASGLVVMNPPYGRRVKGGSRAMATSIGGALRARWGGWRVALLVSDLRLRGPLGLDLEELARFSNGGVDVWLLEGRVGARSGDATPRVAGSAPGAP